MEHLLTGSALSTRCSDDFITAIKAYLPSNDNTGSSKSVELSPKKMMLRCLKNCPPIKNKFGSKINLILHSS